MAMSRSLGAMSFMTLPSMMSSPSVISSRPATMRSVVDLPQPEGPTRTMNSLSAMSRLNSWTATTPSSVIWRLVRFSGGSSSGAPLTFFFFGALDSPRIVG